MKGSKQLPTTTKTTTTMYLKEKTAAVRKALKANGITSRMVSVKTGHSTIECTIKDIRVCPAMVKQYADKYEKIDRCDQTGEILLGGNTYVDVTIHFQITRLAGQFLLPSVEAAIKRIEEGSNSVEVINQEWSISCDGGVRHLIHSRTRHGHRHYADANYPAHAAASLYFSEMDAAYKEHRLKGGSFADFKFVGSWVSEEALPEPQAQEEAQPQAQEEAQPQAEAVIEEPKAVYGTQLTTKKTEPINFPVSKVSNSADSQKCCRMFFHEDIAIYESFFILMLNRANTPIGWAKISQGGQSATVVDAKILAKLAIDGLAANVVLCHNHPSGRTMPSQADIELTKKIKGGLALLDIGVLDHIILTEESYYSFADEGRI